MLKNKNNILFKDEDNENDNIDINKEDIEDIKIIFSQLENNMKEQLKEILDEKTYKKIDKIIQKEIKKLILNYKNAKNEQEKEEVLNIFLEGIKEKILNSIIELNNDNINKK